MARIPSHRCYRAIWIMPSIMGLLTGCAHSGGGMNPATNSGQLNRWWAGPPAYTAYDPCFQCGEDWSPIIPNKRFADQIRPIKSRSGPGLDHQPIITLNSSTQFSEGPLP